MAKWIEITPLQPLLVRDGRSFRMTPGVRARSMNSVPPSVISGTLRTMALKLKAKEERDQWDKLPIRGPLYYFRKQVFVPMPEDIVFYEDSGRLLACYRRPQAVPPKAGYLGFGNEFRHENLWPASALKLESKPAKKVPALVSLEWLGKCLAGQVSELEWEEPLAYWKEFQERINEADMKQLVFLPALVKEERTHTAIKPGTNMAEDKKLYSTEGLVFPDGMRMLALLGKDAQFGGSGGQTIHSLGGKRRPAQFRSIDIPGNAHCPVHVAEALRSNRKYIKMVLVTPAYFDHGWLPRWLGTDLMTNERAKEFLGDITLQLKWACLPRWQPVSGWSYSRKTEKAVRRMVPAGSVYFFEVRGDGDASELAKRAWLASVSDYNRRKGAFDREDGFGLAIWGVWSPLENDIL